MHGCACRVHARMHTLVRAHAHTPPPPHTHPPTLVPWILDPGSWISSHPHPHPPSRPGSWILDPGFQATLPCPAPPFPPSSCYGPPHLLLLLPPSPACAAAPPTSPAAACQAGRLKQLGPARHPAAHPAGPGCPGPPHPATNNGQPKLLGLQLLPCPRVPAATILLCPRQRAAGPPQ